MNKISCLPLLAIIIISHTSFSCRPEEKPHSIMATQYHNSALAIADSISMTYEVPEEMVLRLIQIFENRNQSRATYLSRIHELAQRFDSLQATGFMHYQISEPLKSELKIQHDDEIINLFEWSLYFKTYGENSPILFARGDIEVCYGLPPHIFKRFYNLLEQNQVDLSEYEDNLSEQAKQYKALEKELLATENFDAIAREAKKKLYEGDIDGAERILKRNYHRDRMRYAYRSFSIASAKIIKLDYDSVGYYFKNAISADPHNLNYISEYGQFQWRMAKYDEAILSYKNILEQIPEQENSLDSLMGATLNHLGLSYYSKGDYKVAQEYFYQALSIDTSLLGLMHPDVSAIYSNLGLTYKYLANYQEAITYFKKAIYIDSVNQGAYSQGSSIMYNNLGATYGELGLQNKALELYEKALYIDTSFNKTERPQIALIYNNIGNIHRELGDSLTAHEYLFKALNIDLKVYGAHHPKIGVRYNNIGLLYGERNMLEQAIQYFNLALSIDTLYYGNMHRQVAIRHNNLGDIFRKKGDFDQSIFHFQKAIKIDSTLYGSDYRDLGIIVYNLGLTYYNSNDPHTAIRKFERAKLIMEQYYPKENQFVKRIYQHIELAKEQTEIG